MYSHIHVTPYYRNSGWLIISATQMIQSDELSTPSQFSLYPKEYTLDSSSTEAGAIFDLHSEAVNGTAVNRLHD
jgi:hypothetical protein